mmetsp:Transcript_16264/g.19862  ORF Transcript_16264/g.19862 Transcript_16264/m.19862 type:complete len:186 (-) Transcript_16264:232-789(-)
MATKKADTAQQSRCENAVSHLSKKGITFLALDFDQTVIDIHTGGRFNGPISELASHVRPVFFHLIHAAHDAGMKIAIVTFSPQVDYIAQVLETHFGFAQEIIIRGRDRSWQYEGNGMMEGKQPFMASAAEELYHKFPDLSIMKKTTLLVDDDPSNIKLALKDGVRGILFNPKKSSRLLDDILKMP